MSRDTASASGRGVERTLASARTITVALGGGVALFALVASRLDLGGELSVVTPPAALGGLVAPVIGYRLYAYLREKVPPGAAVEAACGHYLRATVVALAVTEAAALFGVLAFMLGGGGWALVGVPMHLLLTGALWPSEEKLESFVEAARGETAMPE